MIILSNIKKFIKNQQLFNIVELNVFIVLSLMILFTLIALTGLFREFAADELRYILIIDTVLLCFVIVILGRKALLLWRSNRIGKAGAHFTTKVAVAFGVLVAIPTIFVTVFALIFFNLGLESWFSKRVESALKESVNIAESYFRADHERIITDALKILRFVDTQGGIDVLQIRDIQQPNIIENLFNHLLFTYDLTEISVINKEKNVIAHGGLNFITDYDTISSDLFDNVTENDALLLENIQQDRIRAIARLKSTDNLYLLIGRPVDSLILEKVTQVQTLVDEYNDVRLLRNEFMVQTTLLYILITCMLIAIAIWIGLSYASKITEPLGSLINATNALADGDLTVRVPQLNSRDEIATLSQRFNIMGEQLQQQQQDLLNANKDLTARQHFIENVISGVSAGIISLDHHHHIILSNEAAYRVTSVDFRHYIGKNIHDIFPNFEKILNIDTNSEDFINSEDEINIIVNAQLHHIFVRLRAEKNQDGLWFYLLVFYDVTPLLSAQKKAAWVDVARVIAHEIKNPLTPIQLSAERLKRKFGHYIIDDSEKFYQIIDTIIRQVKEIGGLVDGFSSFARMPPPLLNHEDLQHIIQSVVTLHQTSHTHITIDLESPHDTLPFLCDEGQITRIFTNIIKNAIEAIEEYQHQQHSDNYQGRIMISTLKQDSLIICEIEDNGPGFPTIDRHRLLDPYVTRKEMGTGLGLAIVKRIVEEHDGDIILGDASIGGALIKLIFKTAE